jgi:hypothetical protein
MIHEGLNTDFRDGDGSVYRQRSAKGGQAKSFEYVSADAAQVPSGDD